MCGRFERSSPLEVLKAEFRVAQSAADLPPRYNIAPSQEILILNDEGRRQFVTCRWGFLPSWARDPSIGSRMINARAETVATKPAFRSAFKKRRCLVVADGFYEWQKRGNKKIPVYIHLKSARPFGLAGLYGAWVSAAGEKICTCTIITTSANDLIAPVHDRMPAIISKEQEDAWLDPGLSDEMLLLDMLRPYPSEEMELYEVSAKINSPRYDSPDAVKPLSDRSSGV